MVGKRALFCALMVTTFVSWWVLPNTKGCTFGPSADHAGESHLSIAIGFLAIFGPRPSFVFNSQRRATAWLEWAEGNRSHGLARFGIGLDGLIDEAPLNAVVRIRPKNVSRRQWGHL